MGLNIGASFGLASGEDILNIADGFAEIILTGSQRRTVHLTLTSIFDVAHFVATAIELGLNSWSEGFRMRGAHVTTQRLVDV